MAVLSGEQVAQLLYQVGFRDSALVNMVAIGKRESGYKTDAHRTDNPSGTTGDFGLFQINYVNVPMLRGAGIINNAQDLLDPVKNAQAAFYLSGSGKNFSPWGAKAGVGWVAGGNPLAGTNVNQARQAIESAQQQGLLGQPFAGSGAGGAATGGAPGAGGVNASAAGPFNLPADMKIYTVPQVNAVWAVYEGPTGVKIGYSVHGTQASYDPAKATSLSVEQMEASGIINGGSANELATTARDYGTFNGQWSAIVDQVFGKFNDARNDPEVQGVMAEFASRPDMTPAELTNKLQATSWYRTRTQGQLEWNSLSPAEQSKRRDMTASQMIDAWWQFAGVRIDASDPRVANYLEDVASGKMGIGAFAEKVVKAQAKADPNSPYARQTADEEKARRQSGVDIENTAQRVRELAARWGVKWSESAYQDWGTKITKNEASETDVLNALKQQAQIMYPWKDPNMETSVAAAPWIETYNRVMEKQTDLFNPAVQKALQAEGGTPVWQFEKDLKNTPDWLGTKNARTDMYGAIAEAGRRMGFV